MPSLQFYLLRPLMHLMRWWQPRLSVQGTKALVRFRQRADRIADIMMRVPKGIVVENGIIGGVTGDWLIPEGAPEDRVILFLHGGSAVFTWGSPHRRMVGHLAKFAGHRAFGADYRLAPEHIYPAAHDDCFAVYEALVRQGRQVVLVGESSGGVLALAILLRAREAGLPQPKLCALLSPLVDCAFKDMRIWQYEDVFAHPTFVIELTQQYVAENDTAQPDLGPIHADLSGLAPLYVLVGEREILRGDAEWLVDVARRYDVRVDLVIWPFVWHAWHILVPQLPEATSALRVFGETIGQCLGD
jgi:acetyl esterase/lipase